MLVYLTWRYNLQVRVFEQMEKWDGVVLDINATCANLGDTVYNLYTRKQGKPQRIMLLPPTDTNLYLHVRHAHMQMLLWNAADRQCSSNVSIAEYGWK